MKVVNFEVKEDWNTGIVGLVPAGVCMMENYTPCTSGSLLAHDLLEHQNGFKAIGTVLDELEALGGIAYVRGPGGVLNRGNKYGMMNPIDGAIYEEVIHLQDYLYDCHPLFNWLIPRTHLEQNSMLDWVVEELREVKEWPETLMRNIERALNRGYLKAQRRFKDEGWACELFFHMADEVDKAIKRNGLEEGQRYRLRWSLRSCYFDLVEEYNDY